MFLLKCTYENILKTQCLQFESKSEYRWAETNFGKKAKNARFALCPKFRDFYS